MEYIYFFADHPFDIAGYLGIMNVIREVRQDCYFTLIIDSHPNLRRYDFKAFFPRFDNVIHVGFCNYGGFKEVAMAIKFSKELKKLAFKSNSTLFIQSGRFLYSNILLKRLDGERVKTVWITKHDGIDVEDCIFNYRGTAISNLYNFFFGTSYMDAYKARGTGRETVSYIHYRKNPYDFTFYVVAPNMNQELGKDELYFPFYYPDKVGKGSQETVLLCGCMFKYRDWINQDKFLPLYNKIIDLIRKKHPKARFIYLPHPRETDDRSDLDLTGFEVKLSINTELLLMSDPTISTVYSVWSTSSETATLFGIKGYLFYRLFDDDCFSKARKKHYDSRYGYLNPKMFIDDLDEWMSGKNDYDLDDSSGLIRSSILKMLAAIGLV